jgi:hypothetical protein
MRGLPVWATGRQDPLGLPALMVPANAARGESQAALSTYCSSLQVATSAVLSATRRSSRTSSSVANAMARRNRAEITEGIARSAACGHRRNPWAAARPVPRRLGVGGRHHV